jgi:hypothetical protein
MVKSLAALGLLLLSVGAGCSWSSASGSVESRSASRAEALAKLTREVDQARVGPAGNIHMTDARCQFVSATRVRCRGGLSGVSGYPNGAVVVFGVRADGSTYFVRPGFLAIS